MNKSEAKILSEFLDVEIMYHEERKDYFYEWYDGKSMRTYWMSEWNGIMPVVEKIETMSIHSVINGVTTTVGLSILGKYYCYIEFGNMYNQRGVKNHPSTYYAKTIEGKNKLEATYKAVVEFIKWYNENK